ncbi:MAG: T9SS C-terminal target domain-containing protein, partial [Chitinophagaceae bacterium]
PDSGFILIGYTPVILNNGNESYQGYIVRTDKNGDVLWTNGFSGGIKSETFRTMVVKDDNIYIVGSTGSYGEGGTSILFISFSLGSGALNWFTVYGSDTSDDVSKLITTDDGGFLFTGGSQSSMYIVKTDSLGCVEPGCHVVSNVRDDVEDEVLEVQIAVYPNPASHLLNIVLSGNMQANSYFITMTDILGRQVVSKNVASYLTSIDVTALTSGMYVVNVFKDNVHVAGKKVIVR